jgi:hypothetical protein
MKQDPSWEANSRSSSREILRILWNLQIHYDIRNSLSLVSTFSEIFMYKHLLS